MIQRWKDNESYLSHFKSNNKIKSNSNFLQNHLEQNVLNDLQQNLVNALLKKAVMVEWSKLDPEQFFKTSFLQQLFPKLLDGRNSAEYWI